MHTHSSSLRDDFNGISVMQSRLLPIPGENPDYFLKLTAKRSHGGSWEIVAAHNMKTWPPSLARLEKAFIEIVRQYHHNAPENIGKSTSGNFDDAFLILRAMEDSVLKHLGQPPLPEPEGHFMSAYRQLPPSEKARLDRIYFSILRERGPCLPPAQIPPKPF